MLDVCGLEDLGYIGPKFTWCKRRNGNEMIQECLDRCVGTDHWKDLFPNSKVKHLEYWRSNHRPVLMEVLEQKCGLLAGGRRRKRFYFEECLGG